jgi:RNA recognition motif-containing protein
MKYDFQNLFEGYGVILEAKVIRDKETKESMGYGFVKFANDEDAAKAIQFRNGFHVGSKIIKVSIARTSSEHIKNCKVYAVNLPKTYAEIDVRNLFSEVGLMLMLFLIKFILSGFLLS